MATISAEKFREICDVALSSKAVTNDEREALFRARANPEAVPAALIERIFEIYNSVPESLPRQRLSFTRRREALQTAESLPPEMPFGPMEDLEGYKLKPNPLAARTAVEFIDLMKQYRLWAGEPSFREIVKRSRSAVAASTLCEALKSNQLPPLKLVKAFVWACSGSAEDLRVWETAWRQLRMKRRSVEPEHAAS